MHNIILIRFGKMLRKHTITKIKQTVPTIVSISIGSLIAIVLL